MWCKFCYCYMGIFSLEYFCESCSFIKRLYLLNKEGKERDTFIDKLKIVFLKGQPIEKLEALKTEVK